MAVTSVSRSSATLAPGARIVTRTEEWLDRPVDPSAEGGHFLDCDGISDLVYGESALFFTKLEDATKVLGSAISVLVVDASQQHSAALLASKSSAGAARPTIEELRGGARACRTQEFEGCLGQD